MRLNVVKSCCACVLMLFLFLKWEFYYITFLQLFVQILKFSLVCEVKTHIAHDVYVALEEGVWVCNNLAMQVHLTPDLQMGQQL